MNRIKPTLALVLAGFVVPNAVFAGALLAGLAGEPRLAAVSAYCILVVRPFPTWIRLVLFPIVLLLDVTAVIAGLFGFNLATLLGNSRFLFRINVMSDPVFLTVIIALTAALAIQMYLLATKSELMAKGNRIVLLLLTLGLMSFDLIAYRGTPASHGSLTELATGEPKFASGVQLSKFDSVLTDKSRPDVLFVMVESLGQFIDEKNRDLVLGDLLGAEIASRYNISRGASPFWRSTTAAEMRELCATQLTYRDIEEQAAPDCLPRAFEQAGYETLAIHGYTREFFDRKEWYPLIGFQDAVFGEHLIQSFDRKYCGQVWRGLCDDRVVTYLDGVLSETKKPLFLYWLTLNTHVPVGDGGTGKLNCGTQSAPIENDEVCRMTELWRTVTDGVARIAREHKNLEIFLVGDHRPPLMRRAARSMFSDTEVPWIRLSPKRPPETMVSHETPAARPQ